MDKTKTVPATDAWILARDYEEFFREVNLLSAALEAVQSGARSGEWRRAFAAYRVALFERLRRLGFRPSTPAPPEARMPRPRPIISSRTASLSWNAARGHRFSYRLAHRAGR